MWYILKQLFTEVEVNSGGGGGGGGGEVIRFELFLDIVPSSSEDITRAMRGQPKRLSRTT